MFPVKLYLRHWVTSEGQCVELNRQITYLQVVHEDRRININHEFVWLCGHVRCSEVNLGSVSATNKLKREHKTMVMGSSVDSKICPPHKDDLRDSSRGPLF